MKFLVPLLVVLATSEADKFLEHTDINQHHHRDTDIEDLARKLATIIFTRFQNNNNIKPIDVQQVQTFPAQPTQTYETKLARDLYTKELIQTDTDEPIRTNASEPVQTDADEPIKTNESEPVQTLAAESVQTSTEEPVHPSAPESVPPLITSYRRHRTVNMPAQSSHQ